MSPSDVRVLFNLPELKQTLQVRHEIQGDYKALKSLKLLHVPVKHIYLYTYTHTYTHTHTHIYIYIYIYICIYVSILSRLWTNCVFHLNKYAS
jgi:hypothetical protein